MIDESFLAAEFPQDPELCYLNHAAVSPWPKCTQKAVSEFAHENVFTGAQHYPKWMLLEQDLRQRLATLLKLTETDEIALAKSTSEALSIIAYGLDWKPGDQIIISNQEFPSNRIVWESLENLGVELITANIDTADPVAQIVAQITPTTRLVSISSVQYASGQRIDLESLSQACQANNVLFCVDAIQSLGAIEFDQDRIQADFIVADGHKWMMAAEGLALLYVKRPHINALKLHQYGWHMVQNRGNYDLKQWLPAKDATRFECGSPNMLGAHALHASLGLLLEVGMHNVQSMLETRVDHLLDRLQTLPGIEILSPKSREKRAGIVTFKPPVENVPALYRTLMEKQVICANRGGGIRLSPGFYTPLRTIDKAIERIAAELS